MRFELGAATKFTLGFLEVASRPGGRATASRSAATGGSATSAHGLLGGNSGGSDAAGAGAAQFIAARSVVRRWRAVSVAGGPRSEGLLTGAPAWLRQPRAPQRGTFVVAAAASGRRQLPLAPGGEFGSP